MSLGIGLSIDGKTYSSAAEGMEIFSRTFKRAWNEQPRTVGNVVRRHLQEVMEALAKRHSGAYPNGTTDTSLSRRSGETVAALTKKVSVTGTTWSSLKGAVHLPGNLAIHEYGGTIRGKGKMLTIPLPQALNSNGTPKKLKARDWPNTFVAMTKNGNLLIFQRRGAEVVPLYVLRDSVRIKPRLGVTKALESSVPYFTSKAVDRVVKDIMERMKS